MPILFTRPYDHIVARIPNRQSILGDRRDPLAQVHYMRVVDLDIGASKSDICPIGLVTISERVGRTRACDPGLRTSVLLRRRLVSFVALRALCVERLSEKALIQRTQRKATENTEEPGRDFQFALMANLGEENQPRRRLIPMRRRVAGLVHS